MNFKLRFLKSVTYTEAFDLISVVVLSCGVLGSSATKFSAPRQYL